MPVFYQDASAIAKLYLPDEQGADFMFELLASRSLSDILVTSALSFVEVKSAISRRISNASDKSALLEAYDKDIQDLFRLLPVRDEIIVGAGSVVERHRLRAGDAIHLATALDIAASIPQVFMVTSDVELLEAAEAAGLGALDPQMDDAIDRLHYIRE